MPGKIQMDIGAVLIKLKPNTQDNLEEWRLAINKRKEEAIETLKAEGVFIESWFTVELETEIHLIAYMRAKSIPEAQKIAKSSQFDIDKVHKKFKTIWEKVYPATLLVDLDNTP